MRSPVSRFERMAAYFILLALLALGALIVLPRLDRTTGLFDFLARVDFVVHIVADDAVDLAPGNVIELKGIQVGQVERVDLLPDYRVRLTCQIYRDYRSRIPEGSRFELVPAAVVGNPRIVVHQGGGPPIETGATVTGETSISVTDRVDAALVQATKLLVQMEGILEKAGGTLDQLNGRVMDMKQALDSLSSVLQQVSAGRGALGKLVYEEELYDRVGQLVGRLESATEPLTDLAGPLAEVGAELPGLTRQVGRILGRLDDALALLAEGLAQFPATAESARASLGELRKVVESLKRNFLIRGNLPRNARPTTVVPGGGRDPARDATPERRDAN